MLFLVCKAEIFIVIPLCSLNIGETVDSFPLWKEIASEVVLKTL